MKIALSKALHIENFRSQCIILLYVYTYAWFVAAFEESVLQLVEVECVKFLLFFSIRARFFYCCPSKFKFICLQIVSFCFYCDAFLFSRLAFSFRRFNLVLFVFLIILVL